MILHRTLSCYVSFFLILGLQAEFSSSLNTKKQPQNLTPSMTDPSDKDETKSPTETPGKTDETTYPLLKSLSEQTSEIPIDVNGKTIAASHSSDGEHRDDNVQNVGSGKTKKRKKSKSKRRKQKLTPDLAGLTSFMKVRTPNGSTGKKVKVEDIGNVTDVANAEVENGIVRGHATSDKSDIRTKDAVIDENNGVMSSLVGRDNTDFENEEIDFKDEIHYLYDDDYEGEHSERTVGMENIRFGDDHADMNVSDYNNYEEDIAWNVGNNQPFGSMPDDFQTLQGQSFSGAFFGSHGYVGFDTSYPRTQAVSGCPESCRCFKTQVACSGQNFTSVPKGMTPLTTELDLSLNLLKRLPNDSFAKLTHLQVIQFVGNRLSHLPRNIFKRNTLLRRLVFRGNKFKKVPPRAFQNLKYLLYLDLDDNDIRSIPKNAFKGLNQLQQLRLDANKLIHIPVAAMRELTGLRALTFAVNNITSLPNYAFQNNTKLVSLIFSSNQIQEIEDQAFYGLSNLKHLELDSNAIHTMPTAFSHLTALEELYLDKNQLSRLPDMSFQFKEKLGFLGLRNNPIKWIGDRVFSHLPALKDLVLSEVHDLTRFPDLTGTNSLETIQLDRANIKSIPKDLCNHMPNLTRFDIHSNKIGTIPNMSGCTLLSNLNMANNELTSLDGQPFSGLKNLHDLTLSINYIHTIPKDAFTDLIKLEYLNLAENQINYIHPEAFIPLKSLTDLNLGENRLRHLPSAGLSNLQKLKVFHNTELKEFPSKEAFPKVINFVLAYAYHCCDFIHSRPESSTASKDTEGLSEHFLPIDDSMSVPQLMETHFNISNELMASVANLTLDKDHEELVEKLLDYIPADYSMAYDEYEKDILVAKAAISCRPKPGPFMPCDDLFGWWSLRCGVWIVFMLALLGNGVVFLVSVTSRSKMDVPRFLICNLAVADFIMGIYLAILAIVDAVTLGQFKKSAIQWQLSPMCVTAGFLGVFSSELSVFTLTVITLERFYAITNAMQLNKRLSLKHAGIIMAFGWFWCFVLASLPLFGISDYRKFAVCLPFEIEDVISKSYVCFIMVFNGISFFIILGCYLVMYVSIRNSQASNSNDTRVAKRMALLVFTDFLCWSPIAILSLAAAFGKDLIPLNGAKVLTIFVLPLNSCANPFLYAIFTKQFKKDSVLLCRRLEDSSIARHFSQVSQRHVSLSWKCQRRPSALHSLMGEGKSLNSNNHSVGSNSYGVVNYNSELSTGTNKDMALKDAVVKEKPDPPAKQQNSFTRTNPRKTAQQRGGNAGDGYKYTACPTKCPDEIDAEAGASGDADNAIQRNMAGQDGAHIILHTDLPSQTDTNGCTSETYVNEDEDDIIALNSNSNSRRAMQHQMSCDSGVRTMDDESGEVKSTGQIHSQKWGTGSSNENAADDHAVWQKMKPGSGNYKSHLEGPVDHMSNRNGRPHTFGDNQTLRNHSYLNRQLNVMESPNGEAQRQMDNGGYFDNSDTEENQSSLRSGNNYPLSSNNWTVGDQNQTPKAVSNTKNVRHRWTKNIHCCNSNSSPIEQKEYDFTNQQVKLSKHNKRSKSANKNSNVEYVMYMPDENGSQCSGMKYQSRKRNDEEQVSPSAYEAMAKTSSADPVASATMQKVSRLPNEEKSLAKEVLNNNATNHSYSMDKDMVTTDKTRADVSYKPYSKRGKRHRLQRMYPKDVASNGCRVETNPFPTGKHNSSSPVSMLTQEILQHTTVDKSIHLRYFQQSMAGHNFVCKSNSLVELTEAQLEEARSHEVPPCKRRSLTPGQEGFMVLGGETDECLVQSFHHQHHSHFNDFPHSFPGMNNCEEVECKCHQSLVSPLVNMPNYPGKITQNLYDQMQTETYDVNNPSTKFRAIAKDWEDAGQEETGGLLESDSEEEHHDSLSTKNSADKESGFHSQVSQV